MQMDFSPHLWGEDMSNNEITNKIDIIIKTKSDEFASFCDLFIEKMLKIIFSEDD